MDDPVMRELLDRVATPEARIHRSYRAYRVAYCVLYDALPPCQDCPFGAVARALYGVEVTP